MAGIHAVMAAAASGGARLQLESVEARKFNFTGGTATASYTIQNNGTYQYTQQVGAGSGTWLTKGSPSDYEIRATLLSGGLTSGTLNSWLALSTNRTWTVSISGLGAQTALIRLDIRLIGGDGTILDTANISFDVQVESSNL